MPPVEKLKRPLRTALAHWIPHAGVLEAFESKGLKNLYPWQAAALECGEDGHNLVYCAPTSGGKSLVAEVLMIRRLVAAMERQAREQPRAARQHTRPAPARALLVLPYVSIVSEKAEHLSRVLAPMRAKVRGYTGAEQTASPLSSPDEVVAVVTMEKANSTINRLIAEGRLEELCCVVVDEAHMVGDPQRGICLELCLTKLRYSAAKASEISAANARPGQVQPGPAVVPTPPPFSCQLVCMSATMSGLDHMCSWLGARLFMTNFRPVPLTEHAVFKGKVFRRRGPQDDMPAAAAASSGAAKEAAPAAAGSGTTAASGAAKESAASDAELAPEPLIELRDLPESGSRDPDRVAVLVAEVAREGHSTLVFCASRKACQTCAGLLAEHVPKQLEDAPPETLQGRRKLLQDLQDASGGYLSSELERLIGAGVAYHHAGLTSQERYAVERGFRVGLIHTLTATSTLAAGINLPARRVILRSLWQGVGPVSRSQYLQMIGRAGRAGQSPIGEAFLIGKGAPHALQGGEWRDICRLMTAKLPPLRSCLLDVRKPSAVEPSGAKASAANLQVAGAKHDRTGEPLSAAPALHGNAAGSTGDKAETHLQRMLLEAVANGSVSNSHTVELLVKSTLLFQQMEYAAIHQATVTALAALRERKLITFQEAEVSRGPAEKAGALVKKLGSAPAAAISKAVAVKGGAAVSDATPIDGLLRRSSSGCSSPISAVWQPTGVGKAIYESCLPTGPGEELHSRLSRARRVLVLDGGLHLLYHLMAEPLPVEISNWAQWVDMLERMPRNPHKLVMEAEHLELGYAQRLARGTRGVRDKSVSHCRFASAVLLHSIICEGDLHELEEIWGAPEGLTKQGISRGQLQKFQADLSSWAGMAAVMAGSCDWWALQALLEGLAQQAAAGVRPELMPLMALPDMSGARARSLFAAGITNPAQLAAANEEEVKKALAASLPRSMRAAKPGAGGKGAKDAAVNSAAAATGNAVAARGARALISVARQHIADLAAQLAAEEAAAQAAQRQGAEGSDAAGTQVSLVALAAAERLAAQLREAGGEAGAAGPAASSALRGRAQVSELNDASDAEAVDAFMQAWRSQRSYAVAVITSRPLDPDPDLDTAGDAAGSGVSLKRPASPCGARLSAVDPSMLVPGPPRAAMPARKRTTAHGSTSVAVDSSGASGNSHGNDAVDGLVVAWSHLEATALFFSPVKHGQSTLWRTACDILSCPSSTKIAWQAEAQLALLLEAGCDAAGQWDDPRVMWWLAQGVHGPQETSLQELQGSVVPAYAVRVPLHQQEAVTTSCRTALLSWSMAAPLRSMLAAAGMVSHNKLVEAPLTLALARTRMLPLLLEHSGPAGRSGLSALAAAVTTTSEPHARAAVSPAAPQQPLIQGGSTISDPTEPMVTNRSPASLHVATSACSSELSRVHAAIGSTTHLVSTILGRPTDLSCTQAIEALCNREYLARFWGQLPPDAWVEAVGKWPSGGGTGVKPPRFHAFAPKPCVQQPAQRSRLEAISALLCHHAGLVALGSALRGLQAAASEDMAAAGTIREHSERGSRQAEGPAQGLRVGATSAHSPSGAGVSSCMFAMRRTGLQGQLAAEGDGDADPTRAVVVTELSSAPMPALSLQQQYCCTLDGERRLLAMLPIPVMFAEEAVACADGKGPAQGPGALGRALRCGELLELRTDTQVALHFGAEDADSRRHVAVMAFTDPLTRQPTRLELPAASVWCARTACSPAQAQGAARAGLLHTMARPLVLRCPAEELLRLPPGWAFVTVLYPYLHLAALAHCSEDERLVDALYQPDPWAAVAAAWGESQAEQVRRLLQPRGAGAAPGPSPELAARQVVSRALLGGCSNGDLAAALGLAGGKPAAAALVASFLEAFSGVAAYRTALGVLARKEGHVTAPCGRKLCVAVRQLQAGGVAAAAKLQRALCRLQLGAAAADVERAAAALALQRVEARLAGTGIDAAEPWRAAGQDNKGAEGQAGAQPSDAAQQLARDGLVDDGATGQHGRGCSIQQRRERAVLVRCTEAAVTLCVPDSGRLGELLAEVQDSASVGVMQRLGLRVPLHVSVYHGARLGLVHCQQYVPPGQW